MKVQGTYESVVKGVSQQAPADRLEGQHAECVNMIMDPVRGAVRRNGFVHEFTWSQAMPAGVTAQDREDAIEDSMAMRCFPFRHQNVDYDIMWRSRALISRTGKHTRAHLWPIMCYSREFDNEHFLQLVGWTDDSSIDPYLFGGFSAITSVGKYILMAGAAVETTYLTTERWDTPTNRSTPSVWIRGGGYSREYNITVKLKSNGQTYGYGYTTPPAQYPGALDFSTISADPSSPEYTAAVNKIQGEYDTAINQHIAEAAAAIVPSAIAQKLLEGLKAVLPATAKLERWESTLLFSDIESIDTEDGANGEYLQETFHTVTSPDKLPIVSQYGRVVRVMPPGADPFYMEALASGQPTHKFDYGKVMWRETAGVIQTPKMGIAIGQIYKGKFFIATTPEQMDALILRETGDVVHTPFWALSNAGDLDTNTPPHFFNQPITMLAMFQDRLLIGAGGKVIASEQGNYFNFYRTTVLTQPDTDPWTATAEGAQDDTIRKVTMHERNLYVAGDKKHYVIPGQQPVTPATASMTIMWAVDNSAMAQPISNGANMFILKEELQVGASRLLQVQPGLYQDIPQLQDVSQQLRDYINGFPAEAVAFLNPGMVFLRTEFVQKSKYGYPRSRKQGLYVYQYLDNGDQRLLDSWGAWEWSEHLGRPIGIAPAGYGDTLRLYTFVHTRQGDGSYVWNVTAMRCSIRPDPTGMPYLDCAMGCVEAESDKLMGSGTAYEVRSQVYTSPGAQFSYETPLVGHDPEKVLPPGPNWSVGDSNPVVIDRLRWDGVSGYLTQFEDAFGLQPIARRAAIFTGFEFHAYLELTNPFVRGQDKKADTMGRLKLTRLHVTTTRTAGFRASWVDYDGQTVVLRYSQDYSQINYQQSVFVGRDTRHVQIRLVAERWLPMTINGISWQGNYFGERQQL